MVTPTLKFIRIKEQGLIPYLVSKIKNNEMIKGCDVTHSS